MLWKDDGILDTWPKNTIPSNYNPYQKEIEFFWPLTEQISLDLDYSDCDTRYNNCTINTSCGTIAISNGGTWATSALSISSNKIEATVGIETPGLTMQVKKKPNFIKKSLFKILGIDWRIV